MVARPVRLLVVSNSAQLRSSLSMLLYELVVDVYWQIELPGLSDFVNWCEPHLVILAMRNLEASLAAYQILLPALDRQRASAALLGAPEDRMHFPAPHRRRVDHFLSPNPMLHEIAWLLQQCQEPAAAL